jgi:hypothetical protein
MMTFSASPGSHDEPLDFGAWHRQNSRYMTTIFGVCRLARLSFLQTEQCLRLTSGRHQINQAFPDWLFPYFP